MSVLIATCDRPLWDRSVPSVLAQTAPLERIIIADDSEVRQTMTIFVSP